MPCYSVFCNSGKSRAVIGLVGYPNVGKSSTINSLLQYKKVPVSATPGRTKHFQVRFLFSRESSGILWIMRWCGPSPPFSVGLLWKVEELPWSFDIFNVLILVFIGTVLLGDLKVS